ISNADRAMYEAMDAGRNTFRIFTSEKDLQAMQRVGLEQDLHWALERGEFEAYYQPIICLQSGTVYGAETLIRWQHPQRGLIGPDLFIPIAEETGLISEIGEWVLRTVCEQSERLQEASKPSLRLSVNVSRYQFTHRDFESKVVQMLDETQVNPAALVLEVTESAMTDDEENAIGIMRRIRDVGLSWSLDDFGTGYSSLSYLKRFPVDTLKIDRSFVRDVINDADDEALIRAIVAMAHSLKVKVVAEGIETREQREFLQGLGCEYGQGFFFAHPLEIDAFEKYLRDSVARAEQRAASAESPRPPS
ncbi:MAG: PAS domain S-box protein, partial [Gammaproteobacteria bacterium]